MFRPRLRLAVLLTGLAALPAAEPAPGGTVFTAELLTANGNRGAELLKPQVVKGSLLQVKRLREMESDLDKEAKKKLPF